MKVRAVAVASERSNAIGTVELECTPHGLVLVHLGVGAFSEDYAPGALTSGTRVLVPWAAFDEAVVEGDRLFLAFDPALSPHHRLLLANFSSGRSAEPRTIRRQRAVLRAGALGFALLAGVVAAEFARRLTGAGPALVLGAAIAGAFAVLAVGLLADRLVAYGGVPPEGVREAFELELDGYLPSLGRSERPPPKKLKPLTLGELQGLLPRTTFAVVVTLTASGLAALLVARFALRDEPRAQTSQASLERRRVAEADDPASDLPSEPPPRARPRPAEPPRSSALAAAAPAPAVRAGSALTLGVPCRCARSDSLLWADPLPRLSVLVLKQRVRAGRGAPAHESVRKKYTDVDIAVVNNGNTPIDEISLLVLFYEKDRGSGRRSQVASRPLFFEGPLMPGQAIKWGTDAEGTEIEVQAPALGSLGGEGEVLAPSDRFAELLDANHRPVRLHAAMMLAYLGDPRAREGILKLREALREDEAPYLGRLLLAISELRVCRLEVREASGGAEASGCLYNTLSEPKRDLGVKLRGLDGAVAPGDPVGVPPNLLVEEILTVGGEVAAQTGVTFKGRIAQGSGVPVAWEAVADRSDLLR